MSKRILVLGAGGFVGARLVEQLSTLNGAQVVAWTRSDVGRDWAVKHIRGDLSTEDEALEHAMSQTDTVINLATPNEARVRANPDAALREGIALTSKLVRMACHAHVSRFLHMSTIHVYGSALAPGVDVAESALPAPLNTYAVLHLACEHLARVENANRMNLLCLRLTNVVGAPAQGCTPRWSLVGNDLCRQAVKQRAIVLQTDGLQCRDFVPVTDVCSILAYLATAHAPPPGCYNLGSGNSMSIMDFSQVVANETERLTGHRPTIHAGPGGTPLQPYRVNIRALQAIGTGPTGSVRNAVTEMLEFCLRSSF